MVIGKDPGWKPALKGVWRAIIPYGLGLRGSRQRPALEFARILWLSLLFQWTSFGVILAIIARGSAYDERWTLWLPVGIGTASVAFLSWMRARPKTAKDLDQLLTRYTTDSYIGFAMSSAPVLWGFVGYFMGGGMATYLAGIPFGLAGFALMAPTRSNLEYYQRKVRESGAVLSLLDALSQPPPPPKEPRARRRREPPETV